MRPLPSVLFFFSSLGRPFSTTNDHHLHSSLPALPPTALSPWTMTHSDHRRTRQDRGPLREDRQRSGRPPSTDGDHRALTRTTRDPGRRQGPTSGPARQRGWGGRCDNARVRPFCIFLKLLLLFRSFSVTNSCIPARPTRTCAPRTSRTVRGTQRVRQRPRYAPPFFLYFFLRFLYLTMVFQHIHTRTRATTNERDRGRPASGCGKPMRTAPQWKRQ